MLNNKRINTESDLRFNLKKAEKSFNYPDSNGLPLSYMSLSVTEDRKLRVNKCRKELNDYLKSKSIR